MARLCKPHTGGTGSLNARERSSMEKITGQCLELLCALGVDHLPLDRYEFDLTVTFACPRIRVHSISPRNNHTTPGGRVGLGGELRALHRDDPRGLRSVDGIPLAGRTGNEGYLSWMFGRGTRHCPAVFISS